MKNEFILTQRCRILPASTQSRSFLEHYNVIQRRRKLPVQQDFYKDWESYKNGFGNVSEEFWLGNENIRVLCREGCKIRFDLVDEKGEKGFALYQNFTL
ncbi:hypothetical protein AVEN_37354-1, partial [Araneus ventricosus]